MAGRHADARWRRTRAKLAAAVLRLAGTQPIDRISMAALAAEAGLSRSTVYEHVATPREVLEEALTSELDDVRADLLLEAGPDGVAAATALATKRVIQHIERHDHVYRIGLALDAGAGGLQAMLTSHFAESARLLIEAHGILPAVGAPGDADLVAELAARGVAESTVGQLSAWIARPAPRDVGLFLEVYQAMLPAWWPRAE